MKAQLLILTLLTSVFATQIEAQNRTTINAANSEISDNLDLRAVASIFGESNNLQDFERRLNDPKLQISNLDLNNDHEVDYLRVFETIENRTHVIIIQAVLDRDLYQDIATIEVEKDNYNKVHLQVVGNTYLYGQNYIYEPIYFNTPLIYASFWLSNYRPYNSIWNWNYYPSYYYSWNPLAIFRYRNNIYNSLNTYNQYNYVNYRRSNRAYKIYNPKRSNGYERQHPDYSFSRRNSGVNNRYELEQSRTIRNGVSNNEARYYPNRNESQRLAVSKTNQSQRNSSQNRTETPKVNTQQRTQYQKDYSQNRTQTSRENTQQRTQPQRDYLQNRTETPKANGQQRIQPQRENLPSRTSSPTKDNSSSSRTQNRRE